MGVDLQKINNYIKEIDWYVDHKGERYEYCDARFKVAQLLMEDGRKAKAFEQIRAAKNELYALVQKQTAALSKNGKGFDIFEYDEYCARNNISTKELELFWKMVLIEAPFKFDSYMLYLEKNRQEKDRFYLPKREQFRKIGVVDALQDLEDDKIDILSISLPPGTGKTTIEKFFCTWVIGRHPDDYSLFFSHSGDITRMFYDGILDITTNSLEYTFNEIFPDVQLTATNAKAETINFNGYRPFASIQCTGLLAKNSGKVRCNRYLYCDDLIGGIEEALNKVYLDKLWRIYTTDARQRKLNEQVKEIHIATRWSVHDVIGRLQLLYAGSKRARFIAVPDIDPATGKSNFNYKINGISEKFFHDQELAMDDISYRCLYKNEPIEREGLLYHESDIRRYLSLPEREPDAILGICDVKNKGTDYMFLPCFYKYGEDYYLTDCVCDNGSDYGLQYVRLTNIILDNRMQQCEFESNSGGDRVAFEVSNRVKAQSGRCNITSKATESNKETRIIVNSDWIKAHVLFKDKSMYAPKSDYGIMMGWLLSYSVVGKNPHDDVPDGLANFALYVERGQKVSTVSAAVNPFRTRSIENIYSYGYGGR